MKSYRQHLKVAAMDDENLARVAFARLEATSIGRQCVEQSHEIVVFGSMSIGLERADSDIDILCVGSDDFRIKTSSLDLNVIPKNAVNSAPWLRSELASHIAEYGRWIKGCPVWPNATRIGNHAIAAKSRRVGAFMRALPSSWQRLDESFRVKYSVKLRRETQRLLLLERRVPIPPTIVLDDSWRALSQSADEVQERLLKFSLVPRGSFIKDLLTRIDAAMTMGLSS
jgi:hypothetical protein